jgi:hypothetical protein
MIGFTIYKKSAWNFEKQQQFENDKIYESDNKNIHKRFYFVHHPLILLNRKDYEPKYLSEYYMVEILGDIKYEENPPYYYYEPDTDIVFFVSTYTNKLKCIKKLTKEEMLDLVNDGEIKTIDGNTFTIVNKQFHSQNDKPAVITSDGSKYWFKHSLLHRDADLPAIILMSDDIICTQKWFKNGLLHRDADKPAVMKKDPKGYHCGNSDWCSHTECCCRGSNNVLPEHSHWREMDKFKRQWYEKTDKWDRYWYIDGIEKRNNDKPSTVCSNGLCEWRIGHRENWHRLDDKPSLIESNDYGLITAYWCVNGIFHRENNKPAIIQTDNDGSKVYEWYYNGEQYEPENMDYDYTEDELKYAHNGKFNNYIEN